VDKLSVQLEEEFRADLPRTVGAQDPRVNIVTNADTMSGGPDGAAAEAKVFRRDLPVSVLVARLFTGRRHQIRRHLQHAALNILGDTSYGKGRINNAMREQHGLPRMLLHAWRLSFRHPCTGEILMFQDEVPQDMMAFLSALPGAPSQHDWLQLLSAVRARLSTPFCHPAVFSSLLPFCYLPTSAGLNSYDS
jgi:hypothetical protein